MGNKISIPKVKSSSEPTSRDIKVTMAARDMKVKELAERIQRPVPTVSTAINHAKRFPRVRQQIMEVLYA